MTFQLKKLFLRYFPPGILLEYVSSRNSKNGDECTETKSIDLLDLTVSSNVELIVEDILLLEPIIPRSQREPLQAMVCKLQESLKSQKAMRDLVPKHRFQAHIMPMTNCAFDKSGDFFATASYDRTVRIWTYEGVEAKKLTGHKDVVFCLSFNLPFRYFRSI